MGYPTARGGVRYRSRVALAACARSLFGALAVLIESPVFAMARLARSFVYIRIGRLDNERVGHLLANTEFWLRKRSQQSVRSGEINVFVTGPPANRQVLRMIERRLTVVSNRIIVKVCETLRSRRPDHPMWLDLSNSGFNSWVIWNGAPPQLSLTDEEHRRGGDLLRSIGIAPGEPFVCFGARDRAYLDSVHSHRSREEWSYHDYRNSDIGNYLPAVEGLVARGLWACRMGAVVEGPIRSTHPRLIDYAETCRSDFADVYLMAHCKFYLGDTAGQFMLAGAFGVPCALANMTPLGFAARGSRDLFIPKKYRRVGSDQFLTFREVMTLGADLSMKTQQFAAAGIEVVENTAEEVRGLAMEMNARLDGNWMAQAEDHDLQERYRSLFPANHPIAGYPSRVGAEFLRHNRELLK